MLTSTKSSDLSEFSLDRLIAHPVRLFWGFAVAHLLLWTIIPTLVSPNAPLDVIEGYVWGHEWLLGTYKHPPMQAWWLEALTQLTNNAPWTHFLASQIAVITSFWAVWQTGRRTTTEECALLAVLLLEGIVYYNFTSPEFNPNVLQLPFWALIGLYFHRAVKDNNTKDWILLGVWCACSLYTKYSTVLILFSLAVLMFAHPQSRKRLSEKGPILTLLVTIVLFFPHMIWLVQNDFEPFLYARDRMHDAGPVGEYVMRLFRFPVNQLLVISPALLLFWSLVGKRLFSKITPENPASFDQLFLSTVVFIPFLSLIVLTLGGIRVHDMWGTPLWSYAGLWAMNHFHVSLTANNVRRFSLCWLSVFVLSLVIYTGSSILTPYVTQSASRIYFPGQTLAKIICATWAEKYHAPLRYIIGDTWPAGNIAYYPPGRQHVLINGDFAISPWIDPKKLKEDGGVLVWCIQNCSRHNTHQEMPSFVQNFPTALMQEPIVLARQTKADIPPIIIGWALLPPEKKAQE